MPKNVIPERNPHQPPISYPSRLNKEKLQDKTDVQVSKFLRTLKQLRFDISLADALTQMPICHKVLKDLLKNKDKLEELANTPINSECSAILLNKVLKKLGDPGKFLIPCALQDLEVCQSLTDSGASINMLPLSIYEKLEMGRLKPTKMTFELAKRSVAHPKGIAQDVIVIVDKFNFIDFVIVDFEADLRVPIILGRPFLCIAKALVDLYSGMKKLYKPISGSTTFPSDSLLGSSFPSSLPVETSDSSLKEFTDELSLIDLFPPRNDDIHFDAESDLRELEYLLNRDPLIDSSLKDNIEEIDSILDEFVDEPSLVDSFPSKKDDDLFDFENDNDEWRNILYHDPFDDIHSEKDKSKDSKMKILIDELKSPESNVLLPQLLDCDSTLHEELPEINTLPLPEIRTKFSGILVHGSTYFVTNEVTQHKILKKKTSSEALLILEDSNFLSS
uniref:Reverse transcriptase domain-containing protein n=1 Tax=Tanacetum cinerariifolium TaxID=118510 RepID=A0A6L2JT16_TANCI|nr:reverse transcriptase domain-containing protein [Tanacetum cinerariifolium]